MKLRMVHCTTYVYTDAVTTSHHEARLTPRDGEHQRALTHELTITPEPKTRRRRFDYFGNRVVHFSLSESHRELEIVSQSEVEVSPGRVPELATTPPWEDVRDHLRNTRQRDALDAFAMCMDSPYVVRFAELAEYAAPSFTPRRPILQAVRELVSRVYTDFTYDPRATEVSTPLSDVLQHRRGVCQDFAHLVIGCLRTQGLAGRYVSGYLLTHPPPGKTRLVGADASHAWLSTFVPDHGWVDFDPTNDLIPAGEHVTVAYGRDFSDVTPIRGVILGGGKHQLRVAVDVVQTE
ncbi:MAG TPA: transglutaminase family protein [Polyangiales bacterium]